MAKYRLKEIGSKLKDAAKHLAYREWAPCSYGRMCIGAGASIATVYLLSGAIP